MLRTGARALLLIALVVGSACGGTATPTTSTPPSQAVAATASTAPAYPTKAITLETGFAAGGTTDLIARMTADYLGRKWGVSINVVNKAGGNTIPANLDVMNAAPDGYTLLADSIGSSAILPSSTKDLPFKVMDRSFVTMISSNSMLLMVPPNSSLNTLKDVADEAKRDPASFTWTGVGVAEIAVRQLLSAAGVDVSKTKSVVSSGTVSGATLVTQGSVKFGVAAVGPSVPLVTGGLVKAVGIAADQRWPTLPNVPTGKEAGFSNVRVVSWIGVTGPAGLPSYVVKKWETDVAAMLKDPAIIDQLTKFASVADYRDSASFKTEVGNELTDINKLWGVQ